MYRGIRTIGVGLLGVAFLLPFAALGAAMGADPAVGSWALNLSKSKLDPSGPAMRSSVRVYSAAGDGLKVTIHTVDPAGAAHDTGSTFSYDGKLHPVTGAVDYDTIAVTRVSTSESRTELIKSGNVIGHLTRSVSMDGRTMTVTVDETNAKGVKIHDVTVWDKQ